MLFAKADRIEIFIPVHIHKEAWIAVIAGPPAPLWG